MCDWLQCAKVSARLRGCAVNLIWLCHVYMLLVLRWADSVLCCAPCVLFGQQCSVSCCWVSCYMRDTA